MKRLVKKALAVLLSALCILICEIGIVAYAEPVKTQPATNHAIVLVLDVSGSMYGTPIEKMKESAIEFSKKILEANSNNKIAVINFSSSYSVKEFSNNIDDLTKYINGLYAYGSTAMDNAISKAGAILDDFSEENYRKSIVMMADGLPDYTEPAINNATDLFNKYDLYSLGFFHSLDIAQIESARDFMQKIQNKGYYEVKDIDDLIEQFVNIASVIINPFLVNLGARKIETTNDCIIFEIEAEITNNNTKYNANNVSAVIKFNENINVIEDTLQLGVINFESTQIAKWTVHIPIDIQDRDVEYEVIVNSDNTLPISTYGVLFIDGYNQDDNTLEQKDTWSFKNYKVDKIRLIDDDMDALRYVANVTNTSAEVISGMLNKKYEGQCFGMALITSLVKVNRLSENGLDANASTLYQVPKNDKSQSKIGYYYLMQGVLGSEFQRFAGKNVNEQLNEIKETAEKVSKGGNPFVVNFSFTDVDGKRKAHAVTAYGYEKCNSVNDLDYDSKILIYDNNELFADKTICLYFNEGTDEWIIPDYPNCSNLDGGKLIGCISDLNNIDFIDVNANQKNYNSYLKALNSTSFKLIANNIEEYLGKGFEKNNKFVSFEMAGSDLVTYCIPNDNRTFTVLPLEYDKKLELSVENKNYLMNVSVDNCLSAEFGIDGEVSINNNDGDFKISITGNTGYHPLSWPTIEILGNGTTSLNVKKSEKGFVLEGDNLENVTLLARYSEFDTNKVKSKKLTFNTDKSSVLIGESNGNLTVSTDNDNDGVYETLIKSTDSTIEAAKLKSLKLSGIELNPTFDPDTLVYNVTVPHSVSSVELSCTLKENNSATISVNSGETMDLDTTKNYNADLNVGDNKIIISVSGANLSSTSYTINIKRLADDSTTEATTQNINSTTNQNGTPNTGDTGAPTKIVLCILLISLFVISLTLFIGIKRKHKMM